MRDGPEPHAPRITIGFAAAERDLAARLFWSAFQGKLWRLLAPEASAIAFISRALCPDYAIAARAGDGTLLGLAGFKTGSCGLLAGGPRDLARVYGWPGALWRAPLLALMTRRIGPCELLMDGIFVAEEARGQGVGTALLSAIKAHAVAQGAHSVRLDVVDTNRRAQALYLREGFVPVGGENLGLLRHVFGFRSTTRMVWYCDPERAGGRPACRRV